MPRPNPPRSLRSEANLARRIAYERERVGMTYEGLAKRMADAGCPIQASAIYKIEKANPPRRITVDELVAFARIFELNVNELLVPLEVVLNEGARSLLERTLEAQRELGTSVGSLLSAVFDLQAFMDFHGLDVEGVTGPFLQALKDDVARDLQAQAEPMFPDVEAAYMRLLDAIYDAKAPEEDS